MKAPVSSVCVSLWLQCAVRLGSLCQYFSTIKNNEKRRKENRRREKQFVCVSFHCLLGALSWPWPGPSRRCPAARRFFSAFISVHLLLTAAGLRAFLRSAPPPPPPQRPQLCLIAIALVCVLLLLPLALATVFRKILTLVSARFWPCSLHRPSYLSGSPPHSDHNNRRRRQPQTADKDATVTQLYLQTGQPFTVATVICTC